MFIDVTHLLAIRGQHVSVDSVRGPPVHSKRRAVTVAAGNRRSGLPHCTWLHIARTILLKVSVLSTSHEKHHAARRPCRLQKHEERIGERRWVLVATLREVRHFTSNASLTANRELFPRVGAQQLDFRVLLARIHHLAWRNILDCVVLRRRHSHPPTCTTLPARSSGAARKARYPTIVHHPLRRWTLLWSTRQRAASWHWSLTMSIGRVWRRGRRSRGGAFRCRPCLLREEWHVFAGLRAETSPATADAPYN